MPLAPDVSRSFAQESHPRPTCQSRASSIAQPRTSLPSGGFERRSGSERGEVHLQAREEGGLEDAVALDLLQDVFTALEPVGFQDTENRYRAMPRPIS